jgi:hypothetical protein
MTEPKEGGLSINPREGTTLFVKQMIIKGGNIYMDPETAANVKIEFVPDRLNLVTVSNRGVSYPPPARHLGTDIPEVTPITAAALVLDYLSKVRDHAQANYLR